MALISYYIVAEKSLTTVRVNKTKRIYEFGIHLSFIHKQFTKRELAKSDQLYSLIRHMWNLGVSVHV